MGFMEAMGVWELLSLEDQQSLWRASKYKHRTFAQFSGSDVAVFNALKAKRGYICFNCPEPHLHIIRWQ